MRVSSLVAVDLQERARDLNSRLQVGFEPLTPSNDSSSSWRSFYLVPALSLPIAFVVRRYREYLFVAHGENNSCSYMHAIDLVQVLNCPY